MYKKIGVVGDKDSILPFMALGLEVVAVTNEMEARIGIDRLAKEAYPVIFVTEPVAQMVPETIKRYDNVAIPGIILIPSNQGTLGIGKERISANVEKAVGQNIL